MEFRNLLSNVPSRLLDNAEPHNTQQYWIKDTRMNGYYAVYKGSFPNKERRVMICSSKVNPTYTELSFCIDETKIAEGKSQDSLLLHSRSNKDYKLYATESFDNVSLRRYDSMVSHSTDLMKSENIKEMDPISDITFKSSSFWREKVVVANPYFKSVKSYKDYCILLLFIMGMSLALIGVLLVCVGFLGSLTDLGSTDSFNEIIRTSLRSFGHYCILCFLVGMYINFRYLCKGGKTEMFLELVGIDDESPYATVNFKWESRCLESKPYEIICHRDIDLKQLLTLVAVSVNSTMIP